MFKRSESGQVSGWMVVGILVVVALVAIPLMGSAFGGDDSPEGWLRDHYDHVSGDDPENGGIIFHGDDDAARTAADIDAGTRPSGNRDEGGTHYLRYDDDWMVVVADDAAGGSNIQFYEFDEGYRRHSGFVGFWGGFYNRGGSPGGGFFRGGGSGFGK